MFDNMSVVKVTITINNFTLIVINYVHIMIVIKYFSRNPSRIKGVLIIKHLEILEICNPRSPWNYFNHFF